MKAIGSDVEYLHFDGGLAPAAAGRRGREVGGRTLPALLCSLCPLWLNLRHPGMRAGGWMATKNAEDTKPPLMVAKG